MSVWKTSKVGFYLLEGIFVLLAIATVACTGPGEDRPGVVSVDPGSETVSVSGIGSSSATGTDSALSGSSLEGMGGYQTVSDVQTQALVTRDIQEINGILSSIPYDYNAIQNIYEQGKHSVNSDGSVRTLVGFARNAGRSEPIWDDYTAYYNDKTWLDTFVTSAMEGTGAFAGEPDGVRKQGIQKGIQNQIMVSWMLHELVAAMEKAEAGNFDPASGAPHNWDEAWAFYHGVEPDYAPYSTANKRGDNLGTGTAVNDALLEAMKQGRNALVAGDVGSARNAYDEMIRQLQITYLQAAIRYSHNMSESLEAGDTAKARIEQAEGWAFYRVIEPLVAQADASVAAQVAGYFDLSNPPSDAGAQVRQALESVYSGLGISAEEIGALPDFKTGLVSGNCIAVSAGSPAGGPTCRS